MPDHADLERYRPQIRRFLELSGVDIAADGTMRCLSPDHPDEHPSAHCYETNVYCPVCGTTVDIFDACGLVKGMGTGKSTFRERLKIVKETLGDFSDGDSRSGGASGAPKARSSKDAPRGDDSAAPSFVPLSVAEAKTTYTARRLLELALFCKQILRELGRDLVIAGSWTCKDPEGRVEILAVRFERKGDRERLEKGEIKRLDKIVLGFWWDGKSVRFKGCPVRLFGRRDLLAGRPNDPVLIVEGEKCWQAAQAIPGYVAVTWNGGGKKAKIVDWSALAGRDITIYPDDDAPGKETAHYLATVLKPIAQSVRIVEPLPEARQIKPQAADIVEALQVRSPQALAEYLRDGPEMVSTGSNPGMADEGSGEGERDHGRDAGLTPGTPFRTLGTADDGNTYFLDQFGRLQTWKLETINKDKLRVLAPFPYWYVHYSNGEKLSWDRAIEDVLQGGGSQTFDRSRIRGRGAWRDGGFYAFNEGEEVRWQTKEGIPCAESGASNHIYQSRSPLGMGLEVAPATAATRASLFQSASALSFETAADCSRLLAWAVLAPFCGALPVRPAVFLTGQSGSGKSTVVQYVVKRMSRPLYVTNATEAGIRQEMGLDCLPVVNEEMEDDGDDDRYKIKNIFALMRQSFSDDSPRILKGTTQGRAISYVARSMFLYVAIRPGYEREADANRIAVVEMTKPENNWQEIRADLSATWTEDNCAAVRAFVWLHLAEIVEHADTFAQAIHEHTGMDTRYSLLEGILWSAHWRVWRDRWPEAEELESWLDTVYATKPVERPADDSQGMLDRVFAEVVQVFDAPTKRYPLEHLLRALVTGQESPGDEGMPAEAIRDEDRERYRKTASQWGLYVNRDSQLCIALKNPHLVRILGASQYAKVMGRHTQCIDKARTVTPAGETSRRCMVFTGSVLEGEPPI